MLSGHSFLRFQHMTMQNLLFRAFAHLLLPFLLTTTTAEIFAQNTAALSQSTAGPFCHGIASGDPLPDAVILWTRVTPNEASEVVPVKWEIALDEQFKRIEAAGTTTTTAERDFTVKIDANGLLSGVFHYYRFEAYGVKSPVGRTKTAGRAIHQNPPMLASLGGPQNPTRFFPSPNEQAKLAVVSCNNYEAGYFNAFARIAELTELDAVVHLGDYIYEYAPGAYGDSSLHRIHLPDHELITLQDYRTRYGQYRLDPDLQAAHRMHAFICVWDDHEIANDAYAEGAENHQKDEGDFKMRKQAASKAYYEWLPVREDSTLYRQFSFGSVADLFMLDERLAARAKQADSKKAKKLNTERPMLGKTQLDWLKSGLQQSSATWKILGNQVLFAELHVLPVFSNIYVHFDAWDGYPIERQMIKDFLADYEIRNVIFATGDTHASWCFDIPHDYKKYKKRGAGKVVAHEFATPSVTSANFDEYKGEKTVQWLENMFSSPKANPHLRYLDLSNHGYLLLTLSPYDAVVEWRFVEDIRHRAGGEFTGEKRVLKAVVLPGKATGEVSLGGRLGSKK